MVDNIQELRTQMKKIKEEIFQLRLDNEQKKLKNTSLLRKKKDELARILTAIRHMTLTKTNI
jgi:ribosomal protein L29